LCEPGGPSVRLRTRLAGKNVLASACPDMLNGRLQIWTLLPDNTFTHFAT
jgi:hypothetical protein